MKTWIFKRTLLALLTLFLVLSFISCGKGAENNTSVSEEESSMENTVNNSPFEKYNGTYSALNGTYGGVDDLGRVLSDDENAPAPRSDRYVGIFYFLWQGEHGTGGPYDNTKIVTENPDAISSEEAWKNAGGGERGEHHFWGEPLFGYYTSSDLWVIRKHCQMLTDAGVDFICFDTTNGFTYTERVKGLISVWYEYLEQGYKVPKLVFYTNSASGQTINTIYKDIYKNQELRSMYPRLDELWFNWDGKPLIIGNKNDGSLDTEAEEYFRIKANQWPNETRKADGFPWMEFSRLLKPSAVYGLDGRKEVMNVSIAQHSATIRFSSTAWYDGNDRTRSYKNRTNDNGDDAYLYGYNFESQWNYAIKQDPEMVFVTGWNEWVAQRQPSLEKEPIVFVDCADYNTSRDAEPMRGYFGDNYYMQLIDYVRKFKGTAPRVDVGDDLTIDVAGGFDQWENSSITALYSDYSGDTADRNATGFGGISYTDESGRNDFTSFKVAKDKDNFYFYAETAEDITPYTDSNWMTLFLGTGNTITPWYGYNYAVNFEAPENENNAVLSVYEGYGVWKKVCTVSMKMEGNKLMLSIPRNAIGMEDELFELQFKWADNYDANDIWSFYTKGDAAPYGRLNYVYSNAVLKAEEEISAEQQ